MELKIPPPPRADEGATNGVPPLLKGVLCEQYVRCSKPTCHCQNGGMPHGPYFYRVWRAGKKVHKVYVRPENVETVRAACAAYQALQERLRSLKTEREQLGKAILGHWRSVQRPRA